MERDKQNKTMLQKLKRLMTVTEKDIREEEEKANKKLKEAKPPAEKKNKKKALQPANKNENEQENKKEKPKRPFLKIVDSDPHFYEDNEDATEETTVDNEDDVELISDHEKAVQEKSKEDKVIVESSGKLDTKKRNKKRKTDGSEINNEDNDDEDDEDDEDIYDYTAFYEDEKPYDLDKLTTETVKKPRKKKNSFFHSMFKIGQALNAKPDEFVSDEELSDLQKIVKHDDATLTNEELPSNKGEEKELTDSSISNGDSTVANDGANNTHIVEKEPETEVPPIANIDMSFVSVQKVNGNIFIQGDIEPMYTLEATSEAFNVEIGKLSPILMKAYEAYLEPEVLEAKKAEQAKKQAQIQGEEIITSITTAKQKTKVESNSFYDKDDSELVPDDTTISENIEDENNDVHDTTKKLSKKELKKKQKLKAKEEKRKLKQLAKKSTVKDKLFSDYGSVTDYSVSSANETATDAIEDYETPQDARAVMVEINMNIRRLFFRTVAVSIIFILTMVIAVFQRFFPTALDSIIANADMVYCVTNLVLLCVAVGISAATLKNGLVPLLGFKGNSDTAVSVAVVATVIQCVVSFFDSRSFYYGSQSLYVILVLFALILNSLGKMIMELRIKDNFRFVAQDRKKYAATILNDKKSAEKMVRGTNAADPIIAYQRKTYFYNNFLKLSRAKDPSENMASKFSLIGLVCAVIVAILHGILFKSVAGAFSTLALVSCLSVPAACLIAVNLPIKLLCKKVIRSDAMIVGYPAITQFVDTAAIMADSKELYPRSSVKLVALKPYVPTFKLEPSLLNAAAVLKVANTSLTYVFSDVINDKEDELPYVDSVKFEENKGLLGWIGGERVLIGRRELLKKYGVDVPPYEEERPFLDEHRNVTYIANAGQLVAMVVTAYTPDERIIQEFRRLEDNGVAILVRTADPNMTSNRIAMDYGLHIGSVKILPNSLGNICKEAINEKSRRARCYIGTRGKLHSLARAVSGCIKIKSNITMAVVIQIIGMILGILVTSLVALTSGDQGINAFELLCFMVFWVLAAVLVPLIQKT